MKISHFPSYLPSNNNLVYPQVIEAISKTDTLVEGQMDADAALIWSVLWFGKMSGNKKVWEQYRSQNKPVIVIEVGGLLRNQTWKLGINGINKLANFGNMDNLDDSRVEKLGLTLQDWKTNGEYVLICGQHAHSEQWKNMPDMETYYKDTVLQVRKNNDRPIVIRSHPRYREGLHFSCDMDWFKEHNVIWNIPKQIQQTYDSFDLDNLFNHTYMTISYSSNAGITSILNGVPAVVGEQSLAHPMTSYTNTIMIPNREKWLQELSYIEWFPDEIDQQWLRIREFL